jgi:Lon protease-like protein
MKVGNVAYKHSGDLPEIIPVFPLPEALLLPRAEMPLNIFEPRYLAMVDWALAGDRIIGMVQPDELLRGTRRGPRYMITLTGIVRFRVVEEIRSATLFRQIRVTAEPFAADFVDSGDEGVDRKAVLKTFRDYLSAHNLEADWESVGRASNETLVNALAMMAPFGAAEKQALLEAPDLRTRAETLVALTEMSLVRDGDGTRDTRSLQ